MTSPSESEMGVDDRPGDREGLEFARKHLEAMPSSTAQRLALSEAYFRLAVLPGAEIEAAINLLRQAAAYDPYHPKLFFHLGRLLHQNGEPLAAVFEYRRALRLAPRSHRISVHLALALLDAGPEEREVTPRVLSAIFANTGSYRILFAIGSVALLIGCVFDFVSSRSAGAAQGA